MVFPWLVAGVSLAAAIAAWGSARRSARRVEQLSRMYWELKYQYGELRGQMLRQQAGEGPAPSRTSDSFTGGFVPLAELRK